MSAAKRANLVRAFVKERSNLGLVRNMLFLRPVRHVFLGVHLSGSSDPLYIGLAPSVVATCVPREFAHLGLGWPVLPHGGRAYRLDQLNVREMVCETLATQILPKLQEIDGLESFKFYAQQHERRHMFEHGTHLAVAAALGNLDELEQLCDRHFRDRDPNLKAFNDDLEYRRQQYMKLHKAARARDRALIAEMLHEWEEATVTSIGVREYWERTSFPIENQSR